MKSAGFFMVIIFVIFLVANTTIAGADGMKTFLDSRSVAGQVYFSKGSSELSLSNQQKLSRITPFLKKHLASGHLVRIEGHASLEGGQAMNYDLSSQRSIAVQNYFEKNGLRAELFFSGFGENSSSTAKLAEQRRVDIAVYQKNPAINDLFHKDAKVERFVIQ